MNEPGFHLTLVDPVAPLCKELRTHFRGLKHVTVRQGRFEELDEFDCMVSAANSFGLMDGGVDLAITNFFGIELMDRVQQEIIHRFRGEQPVGTCLIVETQHPKHPWLAHSPTMRVPMTIATTDNVYLAMWATLLAVWHHNLHEKRTITHVACPGLGTACGQVEFGVAAKQMSLAYRCFLDPPKSISWPYARARQAAIGRGGDPAWPSQTAVKCRIVRLLKKATTRQSASHAIRFDAAWQLARLVRQRQSRSDARGSVNGRAG